MTPEVKLVDDYNDWFFGGSYGTDMDKLKEGLSGYITKETVLHEPESLPWGGTMVGYDGWVRLCQITNPIFGPLAERMEVSPPKYYQKGNVVLREFNLTIKPIQATKPPFITQIMEKYTVESGRIRRIDEYWADTASLLDELGDLGVLPDEKK
jgi:hypothetical protein